MAMPKADAIALNNPQLTGWASTPHGSGNPAHVFNDGWLLLGFETEHDDSGVLIRRVGTNISEVPVKSEQHTALATNTCGNRLVIPALQMLVSDGVDIEPQIPERCGCLDGEVFVGLELQALSSNGRSMAPSRANSAP